ncbi:competence protein ComEA-like protein with helix-hairpin-helix repeat region [Chthonomonas calidirosea]|uniref:Competence protein ComEA helix-hairpin-helix repeat region n=1 Tax=Chthonomonas calidirosea (strain DSM 23976 / ICMP 18418 / T49) TaxID=1303518 RepID=S0EZ64_CHTCT|nr:ComEA family DNA-binding protein [Chthonomonas calidirosea]CCW36008.1 competence protein ComEA helix-hairpin-helix repeat region [Chthonomonas calidirosea T49]CEK18601.1 competence protein ComEA-like protein with helix-hairpin-helix repeat region [Chthonomonas calidirosea]
METITRRQWIGIGLLLAMLAFGVAWFSVRELHPEANRLSIQGMPSRVGSSPTPSTENPLGAPTASPGRIAVHVAGAVKHPGVYYLPIGARNLDALKAAGGPTAQANTDAVNLAAYAQDASQLYIPTKAALGTGTSFDANAQGASETVSNETGGHSHGHRGGRANKLRSPSEGQVGLNTADAEELERVPGIGPSLAARILAFRQQNGPFQRLEDLMQVSGIGPKKFAKMRPFLRLH